MGRGKKIELHEVQTVLALHQNGFSNRKIAAEIQRSLDVVNRIVKNPDYDSVSMYKGRKSVLTQRQ